MSVSKPIPDQSPVVTYHVRANLYVWRGAFADRWMPERAGFKWNLIANAWATSSPFVAYKLAPSMPELSWLKHRLALSWAESSDIEVPFPPGVEPHPYQLAGIEYMLGLRVAYNADDMGLGKSLQAIGVANYTGAKSVLVVCPAHLRVNWKREILKFSTGTPVVHVMHNTKTAPPTTASTPLFIVASYEAATKYAETLRSYGPFDIMVVDEAHALKEPKSKRAQAILGTKFKEPLLTAAGRVIFMSGSPLPNRPAEIWPVLRAAASHLISDCLGFESFVERYGYLEKDEYAYVVRGSRNETELGLRLRGGFMVRRLKKDVLKQLPAKRYEMVVFPADSGTAKVLMKEKAFNVREIVANGVPAGSPLAEVRREMGEAKLPVALKYIEGLLENGLQKVVLFAHHRAVVEGLCAGLKQYGAVMVIGGLTDRARQAAVDAFQSDPAARVLVANLEAGSTGLTLTAADTLIRVEADWVHATNVQAEDRICRIGQEADSLRIIDLVVENSLDAAVLSCAAKKGSDVEKVLDVVS